MEKETPVAAIQRLAAQLAELHIELAYAVANYRVEQQRSDPEGVSGPGHRNDIIADLIHGVAREHLLKGEEATLDLIDFIQGRISPENLADYTEGMKD